MSKPVHSVERTGHPDEVCKNCGCEICQCDPNDCEDDPFELAMMNCGLMSDGNCSKAGSEECDWECPFSR